MWNSIRTTFNDYYQIIIEDESLKRLFIVVILVIIILIYTILSPTPERMCKDYVNSDLRYVPARCLDEWGLVDFKELYGEENSDQTEE